MSASPTDADLSRLAAHLAQLLLARAMRLVTAESCTAGYVAKVLTDLPGSSRWFECGYVTYSNAAKIRDLGVEAGMIERHGAVSEEVVRAMAAGALRVAQCAAAVAISGIAGPDGGTAEKPVGTVWFAAATTSSGQDTPTVVAQRENFAGDRDAVRRASVACALELVARQIGKS